MTPWNVLSSSAADPFLVTNPALTRVILTKIKMVRLGRSHIACYTSPLSEGGGIFPAGSLQFACLLNSEDGLLTFECLPATAAPASSARAVAG